MNDVQLEANNNPLRVEEISLLSSSNSDDDDVYILQVSGKLKPMV